MAAYRADSRRGLSTGAVPRAVKLDPLALPKGTKLVCELCGKTANRRCDACGVVYYCSEEHQITDWEGIHEKICQMLVPVLAKSRVLGSEDERREREQILTEMKRELLELCTTESQKHLHEDDFELAIPPALQAVRFAQDLYGPGSIELVPEYLLLGEASIGLSRFQQAEEYLSLGKYAILKQENCSNTLKSQLHRNFGKLYARQGKHRQAIEQLAHDVYASSLDVGPDHINVVGGYFQLAKVFASIGQHDHSLAFFDKVAAIWHDALLEAIEALHFSQQELIDEAEAAECSQMLMKILSTRQLRLGQHHEKTAHAHECLGLFYLYTFDFPKSASYFNQALELYEDAHGPDHRSVQTMRERIDQVGELTVLHEAAERHAREAALA
jgi:tetratricopeptide (TPR) repeat protein